MLRNPRERAKFVPTFMIPGLTPREVEEFMTPERGYMQIFPERGAPSNVPFLSGT